MKRCGGRARLLRPPNVWKGGRGTHAKSNRLLGTVAAAFRKECFIFFRHFFKSSPEKKRRIKCWINLVSRNTTGLFWDTNTYRVESCRQPSFMWQYKHLLRCGWSSTVTFTRNSVRTEPGAPFSRWSVESSSLFLFSVPGRWCVRCPCFTLFSSDTFWSVLFRNVICHLIALNLVNWKQKALICGLDHLKDKLCSIT